MDISVIEPYEELFVSAKETTIRKHVAFTGRSSAKTESFSRKVFAQCDEYGASFIVIRDLTVYLKSTIWRTLKRVAKQIGVYHDYKWPESNPLRIVHKSGKYSIDLYGIEDGASKLKGYEGEGLDLCGIWFEEFGNLSTQDKMDEIEETIARSMMDEGVWLYSGNPPKEANSWSRVWVNRVRDFPDEYKIYDTSFADVWHLLKESNKNKIRQSYMIDKDKWEFTYLGKPYTNDGVVYSNFIYDKHCIDMDTPLDEMIVGWSIGVDVAVSKDKTGAVLLLKLANGRIITRAVMEHDPVASGQKLTIEAQAQLIASWYQQILKGIIVGGQRQDISALPHAVVLDTSDFGMTINLQNLGVPAMKVGKKDVVRDIERGRTLINCNRMYFVADRCKPLIKELESILWRHSVKTTNIRVDNYGAVTKQQHVLGADDIENAWRYGHSWLLMGDYQTIVLPPLKEYDEIKEINILKLSDVYTSKGVVRNV